MSRWPWPLSIALLCIVLGACGGGGGGNGDGGAGGDAGDHFAVPGGCSASDPNAPPMGLRVRLKASYDLAGLNPVARTVAQAMKTYGMILADNGGDFYFQGEANLGWNDDIQQLKQVPVSEFEVVGPVVLQP